MISPETVITFLGLFLASDWIGRLVINIIDNRNRKKAYNPAAMELVTSGVCALLRNEIIMEHRMYTQMGYCQLADKQNIQKMYEAYHALGGNDIATRMKNEILDLPEAPLMRKGD